jgi:hypothetical protein
VMIGLLCGISELSWLSRRMVYIMDGAQCQARPKRSQKS